MAHRTDLHIYDAPEFMEAPSELAFVAPDVITDAYDAPLLVDVGPGQPSFFNFNLDKTRVLNQVSVLLRNAKRPNPLATQH